MTKSKGKTQAKAKQQPPKAKAQQAYKIAKQVVPKGTAATVGGILGAMLGPKGAMLGSMAGKAIGKITGVGDYTVSGNTIHTMGGSTLSGEVPSFGKQNDSTRVRHREFISDVIVPNAPLLFNNTTFVINPSNSTLFPWLAKFAENYQQYELRGMVIVFKTTTSDYAASGALGKIALCTNYNVRDSDFATMQEVENSQFAVSGKPSLSHIHPIECAPNNGVPLRKWVRDTQYDASGGDDRLYDVGKFQIATSGLPMTPGTVIGELWVSYDFEFFKPVVGRVAAGTQYTPVSVPVIDLITGSATSPLLMTETSSFGFETPPTKSTLYEKVVSPGLFVRNPITKYDSAKISRSNYRIVSPDPATDPTGLYPCYWENQQNLVLQRKGLYVISNQMILKPNPTLARDSGAGGGYGQVFINGANTTSTSASLSDSYIHHLNISSRNPSSSASVFEVFYQSNNPNLSLNTKTDSAAVPTGSNGKYFTKSVNWQVVVWLPNDLSGSDGINVEFYPDRHAGTSPFTWGGANYFDTSEVSGLKFNITYLNYRQQTYYEPVVAGLSRDDKTKLGDMARYIEALTPKLKELGYM